VGDAVSAIFPDPLQLILGNATLNIEVDSRPSNSAEMPLTSGHALTAALLVPLSWSKWTIAGVGFLAYLCLVRNLRWRRYNALHAKYERRIKNLTLQDAQEIVHESSFWDIPLIIHHAMSFALFKTYGIVSALVNGFQDFNIIFTLS
jgi:hypothetical protein